MTQRSIKLTAKQKAFIKEFAVSRNATRAAIAAGYSENGAKVAGHRALTNANVQIALGKDTAKRFEKLEITAEYVLSGIQRIAANCEETVPMASLKGYELLGKHLKLFTDVVEERGAKDLSFGHIPASHEFHQPGTTDKPN